MGRINLELPGIEIWSSSSFTTAKLKTLSVSALRGLVARGRRLRVRLQSTQLLEQLLQHAEQWRRQAMGAVNEDGQALEQAQMAGESVCPITKPVTKPDTKSPATPAAHDPSVSNQRAQEVVRLVRASACLGVDAGSDLLRCLRLRHWMRQVELCVCVCVCVCVQNGDMTE